MAAAAKRGNMVCCSLPCRRQAQLPLFPQREKRADQPPVSSRPPSRESRLHLFRNRRAAHPLFRLCISHRPHALFLALASQHLAVKKFLLYTVTAAPPFHNSRLDAYRLSK